MAAKDWDMIKDREQQMTLTIRTVDGWLLRVTDHAEEVLLAIGVAKPDRFARIMQGDLTHWIKPMHIASITVSDGKGV